MAQGVRRLTADSLSPHRERDRLRRLRLPSASAWLIQWVPVEVAEQPLERAAPRARDGVAGILSPRLSHRRVEEIAKAIYLAGFAEPTAMLELFRMERVRSHPDTPRTPVTAKYAQCEMTWEDGETYRGPYIDRLRFGRDPCLYARKVKNLREIEGNRLDWDEITMPVSPSRSASD